MSDGPSDGAHEERDIHEVESVVADLVEVLDDVNDKVFGVPAHVLITLNEALSKFGLRVARAGGKR